jgi:DNA-binding MarR family transcriptional regulator
MPTPERSERELPLALLIVETGVIMQEALRTVLAGSGLRPRHGEVLMHVAQTGSATQQHLMEALRVDASVLVGLLNDLETEGLVQRLRDPADRRRHIVALSNRGREEQSALRKQLAVLQDGIFADLSVADRQTLRRLLRSAWAHGG